MREFARANIPLTPTEVQTFADENDRARLSPTALKAFARVADIWKLTNDQTAALLGVSASTWERIKRGDRQGELSQDQFTRVSTVVGIYKALHLLFADDMAERWIRLKNKGPLFNRSTPVEAMIEGGIPRMLEVRRYIDAVRGGL